MVHFRALSPAFADLLRRVSSPAFGSSEKGALPTEAAKSHRQEVQPLSREVACSRVLRRPRADCYQGSLNYFVRPNFMVNIFRITSELTSDSSDFPRPLPARLKHPRNDKQPASDGRRHPCRKEFEVSKGNAKIHREFSHRKR